MRRAFVGCFVAAVVATACSGATDPLAGDPTAREAADAMQVSAIARELPGCELAALVAPEVADELAATVRTDATVGPAVLSDDDRGGRTLTATLVVDGGASYDAVFWAVEDGANGPRLLPLTEETVAVSPPDADASRLLGPSDDIVQGDTPGSGGMAVGSDCSFILAQELYPPPPAPPPMIDEDLITAFPSMPAPGEVVELTFPQETTRGVAFQLDERVEGEWVTTWWMTSDANGDEPLTVAAGTSGYGIEDVGIGGPGPDRVRIHPDTVPGRHRLCTANAGEDFCTEVEVTPTTGSAAVGSPAALPPDSMLRDDLIVAAPSTVRPGEVVALRYPQGSTRGVGFRLDALVDGVWDPRWYAVSNPDGGDPPRPTRVDDLDPQPVPDIGITGPGPDLVEIHPDTEPGRHRLCTNNADLGCVLLDIIEP